MSLNYWPNLALVLFLLFVYLESKEIVKRQQPSTELVQILKSRSATVMPSSQSWDEYGNIVINGRMAMSSSFAVISQIKKEAALSVVICRQGAKAKCEKPGLVLCYETHYLFDDGEIDRKDEFFKYVSEICAGDSGFVVTTENEDVIRIDTRFGNTYRVKLKTNDNCIILWLSYDILSEDEKESFLAHKNYPVYPITHSLDQQKPNNTGLGPEYVQNWNLVPKAENKELIKMFWKEIHVQPKLDEIYSTVLFSASGGDPCCALTAKIMGHEVVKCYMKWENMGTACVAPDIMGHKHECQVSAVLGYDNYTKIWMSNDTSTGMSESKKRSFYEMVGQIESSEMAVETFNETMKETRQALSEKYDVTLKEPDNSEIKGHLDGRLEANFELIEGELNAEGNLELIKKVIKTTKI